MQKKLMLAMAALIAVSILAISGGSATSAQGGTPAATMAATMAGTPAMGGAAIPGSGKITGAADGEAKRLNASGATFPLELYKKWNAEYKNITGVEINYAGGGSGQGKKDINSQAVDYAGSDSIMSDDELKAAKGGAIVHIASTMGAIVPIYNIAELKGKDPIKLTGDLLAQIYLGTITKWNDPKLVADNPGLKDINKDITVVYRSDGSGTTNNFTIYLSAQNGDWKTKVGAATTVKWPVGIGANGNPGVANEVTQDADSIGYVELAFVGSLQAAQMKNTAGKYVTATSDSISAAALGVDLPDDMRIVLIGKSTNDNAWPITTLTWLLVYTNQTDPAKALALTRYLWWATHDGQADASALGYAPLPAAAAAKNEANILKITVSGKQALPTSIATPGAAMTGTMAATQAK